jgi:hypothetical protein
LPARTRLRAPQHRTAAGLARLKEALAAIPVVERVDTNLANGSLTLYHPQPLAMTELQEALASVDEIVLDLLPPRVRASAQRDVSQLSESVVRGFRELDRKVARSTEMWVDLKMLIPLGLLAAAAVRTMAEGGSWASVPPYILLYYAFDSYMKFHSTGFMQAAAPGAGGPKASGAASP